MTLIPTAPHLFFSKNDPSDPRLGELFKQVSLFKDVYQPNDFAMIGYPDDEGIKMNGGRPGALEAPKLIRQFLYKMTPPATYHEKLKPHQQPFHDVGDLEISGPLANRHQMAEDCIEYLQKQNVRTLSLGGGHDYGYADTSAFIKSLSLNSLPTKPLIINFDAHLDVRPVNNGFNSGTPFYRLLSEYSEQINFVEIGLQPQCNSLFHRHWALEKKAHLFDLKDVTGDSLQKVFDHPVFKNLTHQSPVFVSFDIDCLSSSEGGGCSQSWATGLKVENCLNFLNQLYQKSDVRGLGIYEVSPPLDHDFKTSKTAALLAYSFLFQGAL